MSTKRTKTQTNDQPSRREEAKRAFLRALPRIQALDADELMKPNVNVARAVGVALAAEPRIAALASAMEAELPHFDLNAVRELREIALATWYAHVAPRPVIEDGRVKQLVADGAPLKRTLLLHADALADRGIVGSDQVAAIRRGRGNLDLANDLVALSDLFRSKWSVISEKMAIVQEEELDRAAELGTELLQALGARDVGPVLDESALAAEVRWRAFTLLAHTYEEIRAAVRFLRRGAGDADEIAPTLYVGRTGRRTMTEVEEPVGREPVVPVDSRELT